MKSLVDSGGKCTGMVLVRDGCEVHLCDPCVRVSRLPRTVFLPVPWNSLIQYKAGRYSHLCSVYYCT